MISYRKSIVSDSTQIARIHLESFPNFFLSSLGYTFLNNYYQSCVESNEAISISALDEDNILLGYAVGCFNSKGFNKRLILSNTLKYIYLALRLLFTRPIALIRLFKNIEKIEIKEDKGSYAELLSIAVAPIHNGLGIGQELLLEFERQVIEKGINKIALTTDANSNDYALRFYQKCGYRVYYEFVTYPNRKMYKLIKELPTI